MKEKDKQILNLTQHPSTPEQAAQGVFEPSDKEKVRELLTFHELPDGQEILSRVNALVWIAAEELGVSSSPTWEKYPSTEGYAMIGGAPFLMPTLDEYLKRVGIQPLYAFSRREVVEETLPNGSVKKTQVFRHLGFVEG